jgi:hypothetical protein
MFPYQRIEITDEALIEEARQTFVTMFDMTKRFTAVSDDACLKFPIFKHGIQILRDHGYDVITNDDFGKEMRDLNVRRIMEFHRYALVNESKNSIFTWHTDIQGNDIGGAIATIIMYPRVDEGLKGGDLWVAKDEAANAENEFVRSTTSWIPFERATMLSVRPKIAGGMVCNMLRGDWRHNLDTIHGTGERWCIVIQARLRT